MNTPFRLLACVILLLTAVAASAQTINVAFRSDPYSGLSARAGSTVGDVWNSWSAPNGGSESWTFNGFKDTAGNLTEISANATTTSGQLWNGGLGGNDLGLFDYYWHINDVGTLTITLDSLVENGVYDLYIYGARNAGSPESQESQSFTVEPTTYTTAYDGPQGAFQENVNYVRFTSITADSKGLLTFTTNGLPNGFTLTAVPEPSTYAACAGLVVLGLAVWRRRVAS